MTDEYPRAWRFDKDGETVTGRYAYMTRAATSYAPHAAICNLVVESGGTVAVWLTASVLRQKFADELRRRGSEDFNPGEEITITRGAEKREAASGHEYWPFTVQFWSGEQATAAAILNIPAADADVPPGQTTIDDEIPF